MLLLLSCWMIAGITAKDPPTTHYRLKNGSICIQVEISSQYTQLTWLFNEDAVVLDNNITRKFKDKVIYDPSNHSLCITKLAETDSGIYTFSFFNSDFKRIQDDHRLIVQETVPRPVMRMTGLHYNLSAGSCNITVNCSVGDEWVWSVCDGEGCRTSQRSRRKLNISITTDGGSIVCSGNNDASSSSVSQGTEATCLRKPHPEHKETPKPATVIVIGTSVVVCVALCAFAVCVAKRLCSTQHNQQQRETPAAGTTQCQPVEAKPRSVSRVSRVSSSSQAEACYENVEAAQPPRPTSSPTISPREESASEQSLEVKTVYGVLSTVTSSLGKSGGGGVGTERLKATQETSTSQYVTLQEEEEEEEEDINTLYSVLQMPKKLQDPQ
ncbi:uncharacterized protein si:ch1073-220m6.1 [Clinocottus analis]|uniref:uncharacterized protein si:ch1073-220m6.1 n=1 Tax=Clinocottus analis TaxID=304258 RepID=UPI0035C0F8B6